MSNRKGRPSNKDGKLYRRPSSVFWWMSYPDRERKLQRESTGTEDELEAKRILRDRLDARDDGTLPDILAGKALAFDQWADWFLEKRSRPPFRSENTHQQNLNALKFLRPAFGKTRLAEITSEEIEDYIERRLCSARRVHTKFGIQNRGKLKPATVHQEYRILNRILNVAVQKKRLHKNPCIGVEFPVPVAQSTRKPRYLTASEQERIEFVAPAHLRNIVVMMVETGLRPYKELLPTKKCQVDLENKVIYIPNSKTPNGVAEIPLSEPAYEAFRAQMEAAKESEYLFPTPNKQTRKPHLTKLRNVWISALRRARVPYFAIYELRHTFATRLSAGGVADHFVTQMLRQGDSAVFKRYSHAKLNMMREALAKIDRKANEHQGISGTEKSNQGFLAHF